jgi:SNF2 family DNA or RNA helicase
MRRRTDHSTGRKIRAHPSLIPSKKCRRRRTWQPILRPYQVAGFQWLNYLKEVSWGGILADDMGLGKTVQALSLCSIITKQTVEMKALVVCPTTLIYNWENEIKKFTPSLEYYIHHGNLRSRRWKRC